MSPMSINNISTTLGKITPQSASSWSPTLNKGSGLKPAQPSWNQYVDEDVFTRIKPISQLPVSNGINYTRLGYFNALAQDTKPNQTPLNNLLSSQRQAIELQSRSGPDKLSYDRPLSNQDSTGGTNKLNYDMNYIYHPESPLLSLERARSLAQLAQLNAAGPGLQYIRPLLSTDVGNLSPLSQVAGSNLNQFSGGINLSSRSGIEQSSKSEEHHQRRIESQSRQSEDTNNKLLVTNKEQQSGTKSGSGREFEFHQTTNHNLLPSNGPEQLQPPPPYLNSKVNVENVQFQAPLTGAIKGGGSSRLQAPYAGFSQQQQQRLEQAVKRIPEQYDRQVTLVPTSPLPPSPPALPSQTEEPPGRAVAASQEFQQQDGPTLAASSGSEPQHSEQQQATKSTLGPFESQEQQHQTTGTQIASSTTAAAATGTSSSSSQDYDQNQEQARKGIKSGESGETKRSQQQKSESWLGATRPPSGNSISAPIRTVRMQPDEFRASMMMNDLRSMQNTFGLPQPPRLQREPSLHEIEQFQTTINPTPNLDQILASRMSRVDALLSSARTSSKSDDSQSLEPQNDKLILAPVGSSNQQAASMQQSVALSASGSRSNEILDDNLNLARAYDNSSISKPVKHKKPVAASASSANNNNNLDELAKQRFQTGPLIKLSNSLDGGSFNEAALVPAMNETFLFDARRLSAANKAKLQAERVSELEKFQQRLRTQQLLLEQIKNPTIEKPSSSIHHHLASQTNKTLHQLATTRHGSNSNSNKNKNKNNNSTGGNQAPVAEQVNSHVKYDEEADGSIASSRAPGTEARGHNQSSSLPLLEGYKPILFKLEPKSARDYTTRLRRQNSGSEASILSPSSLQNENQKLGNSSEGKLANVILNSSPAKKTFEHEFERKSITVLVPATKRETGRPVSRGDEKVTSDFAQQIKQWPSILQQNNAETSTNDQQTITNGSVSKLFDRLIDSKPPGVAGEELTRNSSNLANKSAPAASIGSSQPQQTTATNTINLDFINSVTALSVDHLNPFAISSVNPAVQRSSSSILLATNGGGGIEIGQANGNSNSNKRGGVNGSDGHESRLSPHKLGETGPTNIGVATTNARYFNSPEILAALDYHEKRDTSGHLKSLLPDESVNSHKPMETSHVLHHRPSNHRFGADFIAPYSMKQFDLNQLGTRKQQVSISGAPVAAATTTTTSLEGSLSPQKHKISSQDHSSRVGSPIKLTTHEITNHKLSTSQQYNNPIKLDPQSSLVEKDGFEIQQNSAHVQVDNQRFYEVVSSFSPANDYASSQAFRG